MVGIGTVEADNPLLTSRLPGKSRSPDRVIVDTQLRIPLDARLLNDNAGVRNYIIAGENVDSKRVKQIESDMTSIIRCALRDNHIDLAELVRILGNRGIISILFEGGAALMGAMIRERLVHRFLIFKAPKILGGGDGIPMAAGKGPLNMNNSLKLENMKTRKIGEDILIIGYPVY